jgi:hypothetical protein
MSLTLNSLPPADEEALPLDPSEAQLSAYATALLHRMVDQQPGLVDEAVLKLRRVLNLRREQEIQQATIKANLHYTFARPHKSATPLHPVYEQLKVLATDLAAFCREFKVKESGMLRVAAGTVDSFEGWRQGMRQGSLETPRRKVIERNRPGPPVFAISGPATQTPKTGINAVPAPVFLPSVWWVPDAA